MPRHPPNALLIRSRTLDRSPCDDTHQMSESREQMSEVLTQVPVFPDLVCAMTRESAHANTHTVGDRCQRSEDRCQGEPRTLSQISGSVTDPFFDNPTIIAAPSRKERPAHRRLPKPSSRLQRTVSDVRKQMSDVRHRSQTPQHNNLTNTQSTIAKPDTHFRHPTSVL